MDFGVERSVRVRGFAFLLGLLSASVSCARVRDEVARCTSPGCALDGDAGPGADAGTRRLVADPVTLDLDFDTAGATTLVAFAVDAGGTRTGPVAGARFTLADATLGTLETATGIFMGRARVAGQSMVHVVATVDGVELATDTMLRVRRRGAIVDPGVVTAPETLFSGAASTDASLAPTIRYPLDGAIAPRNVPPMTIQWSTTSTPATNDVFRITLQKPNAELVVYASGSTATRDVPANAWETFGRSDRDASVVIAVARAVPTRGVWSDAAHVSLVLADAELHGDFFISSANLDGTGTAFTFLDRIHNESAARETLSTPAAPLCIGCHAMSHDGRYMAARLGPGDNYGAVFDLVTSTVLEESTSVFPPGVRWFNATWSPTGDRLVVDVLDGSLQLVDARTGIALTPVSGTLPSTFSAQPSWAPDGHAIAFSSNVTSWVRPGYEWILRGDLAVIPVLGPDAFGAPAMLHDSDDARSPADGHPSWSPDSRWIAFSNGNASGHAGDGIHGTLMMVSGTGLAQPARELTRAVHGASETWYPRFAPMRTGGYYWLAFQTNIDYGTTALGGPQIWVTAIDADWDGTGDPSHPPYWVAGQRLELRSTNIDWAARACLAQGESCTSAETCCTGVCSGTCQPAPSCRARDELCGAASDCCDTALRCVAHVCTDL